MPSPMASCGDLIVAGLSKIAIVPASGFTMP